MARFYGRRRADAGRLPAGVPLQRAGVLPTSLPVDRVSEGVAFGVGPGRRGCPLIHEVPSVGTAGKGRDRAGVPRCG
ncbi:MAG: hypothetical protein CMH34_07905 [Microbacterium sp.]|nr:hypothetical protein [Microbacterium sp.]